MVRKLALLTSIVLLCLGCSWSSALVVANTTKQTLMITARYRHDLQRASVLPILFADVEMLRDRESWQAAPDSSVTVDIGAGVIRVSLPARTAVQLGLVLNCEDPQTCATSNWSLSALELAGSGGTLRADGNQVSAVFAKASRQQWVLWYR